jgi:hypothetical protein
MLAIFGASAPTASALTFDNNACLRLSDIEVCDKHVVYAFKKLAGPTTNPCGMPWYAYKVGTC